MSPSRSGAPLDWFAEPFHASGEVDWEAARQWVGALHHALAARPGPEAWTDAHGAWLGRLAHDTLRFQGGSLAGATTDDLDDLLFVLQAAQTDSLPGPPALAVDTLQQVFRFGLEQHGAVSAGVALDWLLAEGTTQRVTAALSRGGTTPSKTPARPTRRSMPRRKKGKKRGR